MEGAGDNNGDALSTSQVAEISIKLPAFWPEKPDIWFHQVEAQFKLKRITSEQTKFDYLLAQLDKIYVENIYDLATVTANDKYTQAKNRLIALFKESEEAQIKKLASGLQLGSLKPSQLLRKMRALAGANFTETVFKTLWLEKLPENVRTILVIAEGSLDKLAELADRISETRDSATLYAVEKPNSSQAAVPNLDFQVLAIQIEELKRSIEELKLSRRSSSRSCSSSRDSSCSRNSSRSHNTRRRRFNPNGKFCYAHFRYGRRCLPGKCVPPCQWSENASRQHQ